jgi:arginyl-tRNA synthetase
MLGYRTMFIEFDPSELIERIIRETTAQSDAFEVGFDPQVRPADERFGDFQANGILPYAKKEGLNPRDLGQKLIELLPQSDFWETEIAGPGFIILNSPPVFITEWIEKFRNVKAIQQASSEKAT